MATQQRGTSRQYLLSRLDRDGHFDLLAAVLNNQISCYAAAEAAGYVRRPKTLAGDNCNQARRRNYALACALGEYERRKEVAQPKPSKTGQEVSTSGQAEPSGTGSAAKTAERDDGWQPPPFDPAALIG